MQLHTGVFTKAEQATFLQTVQDLNTRPVPGWLGNFQFRYWTHPAPLPPGVGAFVEKMSKLVPDQVFNTVFIQRYDRGAVVKPHRDPKNNLGYTLIAPFGVFEGARTTVGITTLQVAAGDVFQLECTINGVQGPLHSVSEVTSGSRWALILNTIK